MSNPADPGSNPHVGIFGFVDFINGGRSQAMFKHGNSLIQHRITFRYPLGCPRFDIYSIFEKVLSRERSEFYPERGLEKALSG